MASSWIVKRTRRNATRYVVRFRVGGRDTDQRHGGAFKSRREAEARQRYIAGELAALRVPVLDLDAAPVALTVAAVGDQYLATRIDATENTLRTYRQALAKLGPLADRDPATVRVADVQEWITGLVATLGPATVRKYLDPLRAVLDFAEVAPNPARSPILRLPAMAGEEISPPSHAHVEALIEAIAPRHRLPIQVLAETGLRSVELEGADLGRRRPRTAASFASPAAAPRAAPPGGAGCRSPEDITRGDRRPRPARGPRRRRPRCSPA